MISTKSELLQYLNQDAKANKHTGIRARLFGDEIWKYIKSFRYVDYFSHQRSTFSRFCYRVWSMRFHVLGIKLGFSISNCAEIGPGFAIAHYGSIVIHSSAVIGKNFRIHEGTCIGTTNGSNSAAKIGDNVFISTGAKIIGDISIANDVAIGANAVVVKSIDEPGTTWGGYLRVN